MAVHRQWQFGGSWQPCGLRLVQRLHVRSPQISHRTPRRERIFARFRRITLTQKQNMAIPLAERLRPVTLDDYIGQKHLVGEGGVIRKMIETKRISSFILWGPPG